MQEKIRFTTDGLVIRERNAGENDRLISVLTRDRGVINAFAAGAKTIKSKKGAATGLLSYSSFAIVKRNGTYKIYEAVPQKIFFGAGSDIVLLSLAQYFCELCVVLVPAETDSEEYLRLVLNSLHFLTEKKRNPAIIKAITELRTAVIAGYAPDIIACDGCGAFESNTMYFYPGEGKLRCADCKTSQPAFALNKTLLSAMRHIVFSDFSSLYSFKIPERDAQALSKITERYILTQTEHRFLTLDFYNGCIEHI